MLADNTGPLQVESFSHLAKNLIRKLKENTEYKNGPLNKSHLQILKNDIEKVDSLVRKGNLKQAKKTCETKHTIYNSLPIFKLMSGYIDLKQKNISKEQ